MITIQEKALKYAKKVRGCFLIKTISNSIGCWNGETKKVTNLKVEILKYFNREYYEDYDEYEYQGIKVYILNSLILSENVHISILLKLPFMKPKFSVSGIAIQ